jgi:hypothetical protein
MNGSSRTHYLNFKWIIVGAICFGCLLFIGFVVLLSNLRSYSNDGYYFSTAMITIIPAPTLTPVVLMPIMASPSATATIQVPVPTGGIAIGAYVKITGTNGEGLNMRSTPGVNSLIRFLGLDAEVFLVKDGPQQIDNIIWWLLQAPYDASRNGWAAANYLTLIQTP